MMDNFVVPDFSGQTVTVTGTNAAERFILSDKFRSTYSIVIKAQGGNDVIPSFDLNGAADLTMGDGDDKVSLGTEAVDADLGSGDDEFSGSGALYGCVVNGGSGNDKIECSGDTATAYGGPGNDTIWVVGPEGALAKGGPGNDKITIVHLDGDRAEGEDGNDVIEVDLSRQNTSSAIDVLGGEGNDTIRSTGTEAVSAILELWGGPDLDKISCGVALDRVHFTPANTPAGSKRDIVYKFADGTDKLVPEGDANRKLSGVQDYQFVGQTRSPKPGTIGWYSVSGGKIVIGNDDKTVFEIKLDKFGGILDPTDFIF
jgi:hypothetical protein